MERTLDHWLLGLAAADGAFAGGLARGGAGAASVRSEDNERGKVAIMVLRASEAELAAHAQQLADIEKASGGKCLWKNV